MDFLPCGTTANAECYRQTLQKLWRAIESKRRVMPIKGICLHHDDICPHTAIVMAKHIAYFECDIVTLQPGATDYHFCNSCVTWQGNCMGGISKNCLCAYYNVLIEMANMLKNKLKFKLFIHI